MAARSGRSRILLPLLALVLLRASAAAPSPERAVTIARAALDRADVASALTTIDTALRDFEKRDVEAVWMLRVMRVEAQLLQGDGSAASRIPQLPPKYQQSKVAVWCLLYRAVPTNDRKLAEQARVLAAARHPDLLAEAYRVKALVEMNADHAREAIRIARARQQHDVESKAYAILVSILMMDSRYEEAAATARKALNIATFPNVIQNVQGNLGWVYIELGDYEMAEELFTQAEATAAKIGNAMNRGAWLIQLGNLRHRKGDYAGAERYNRTALEVTRRFSDRGYAFANLARIALLRNDFDAARQLNLRALEEKRRANNKEAQRSSDIVEARILAGKDRNYAAAEKLLRDVLAQTEDHRLDAQTQLARLYVLWKRPADAEAAFRQAAATVHDKRNEIRNREMRMAFFNTSDEMFDAYLDFLVDAGRGDDALLVAEAVRAESLEEGRGEPARRLDPAAIAKANGATILSYWLGRERSYLWTITANGTRLNELPPDLELEPAVIQYQRRLGRDAGSMTRGEKLYATLVAPAKIPRNARVIVIADGALHTLNFETLVAPNPQRYWIADAIVANAASLQLLAGKRRASPAAPSMLLVGNTPSPDRVLYPPLLHAPKEMRAVEKAFAKRKVLEGPRATLAGYRAADPGKFDYLHFVAHGVAAPKRPLDSFIVLAPDRAASYKLVARDVQNEKLNALLVTISSCEGVGKATYTGEGIVGLAWAFQRAGADQVIAALWNVSDAATATLMADMYDGIRKGRDPAMALRDAKLRWMKQGPVAAKPRYWAPFVLYAGT